MEFLKSKAKKRPRIAQNKKRVKGSVSGDRQEKEIFLKRISRNKLPRERKSAAWLKAENGIVFRNMKVPVKTGRSKFRRTKNRCAGFASEVSAL